MRIFASPRHRAPLLILLALALGFWSRVLFTGQVLLPGAFLRGFAPFGNDNQAPWRILQWDALGQYYPWRAFVARELHAGRLPLWNPHQFCGTPLLANGQSAVFYPLNLPFWILDPAYAFGVSAFLHTLLAAFGTYFLAQRWQMSRAASLLAAVAFAFCGYLSAWFTLPTLADTAAWLPLLLWSAECGVRSKNSVFRPAQRAPAHSALLACALLAGHPQIFFFLLLALALHALFLPQRGRAMGQLIFAGALAGLLGAIQLLPMLELAKLGHRAVGGGPTIEGWAGIAARGLKLSDAASLLMPSWPMSWGSLNENFGYVGFGVALLALFGCFSSVSTWRGQLGPRFAIALTLLGLFYAFATPLPQLLYWNVPGLAQMGGVGRALFLWSLGAALLAGFGLDALRRKITSPVVPLVALLVVTGELFAFGGICQPTAPRESIYPVTETTTFLQKNQRAGERIWFITPREGWLPSEVLQPHRNHPPGVLPPNGATVYGLNDINGYDSLAPRAYREWLAQFTTKLSPELNGNMILLEDLPPMALNAMNVRYVVSLRPREETGETLVLNTEGCFVYERKIGEARRVENGDFYPGWRSGQYQPEAFRFGTFVSLCAVLAVSFQLFARSKFRDHDEIEVSGRHSI